MSRLLAAAVCLAAAASLGAQVPNTGVEITPAKADSLAIRQAVLRHLQDPSFTVDSVRLLSENTAWAWASTWDTPRIIRRLSVYRLKSQAGRWVVEGSIIREPQRVSSDTNRVKIIRGRAIETAQQPAPPRPTSADIAAILRAAPADSGLWYYVVHQIVGDTAWVQSWRRIQPGDTTVTDYNGQRITSLRRVTRGYRRVERRDGVWTLVPLPPPR